MDCQGFQNTFSEYVDAALDARAAALVREHLAACAACRSVERGYRAGVAELQARPELALSRDFGARVVNQVRRAPVEPTLQTPRALAASFAAIVLVGALVADFAWQGPGGREAVTATVPARQAPEQPPQWNERMDFVTVRATQRGDLPFGSPYPAFEAPNTLSAVRVRFDVAAVWAER